MASPFDPQRWNNQLSSPATRRNRGPILEVLQRVLPARGLVLELASGTGEHAAWLAPRLPRLEWQPSDPDPMLRDSIAAWLAEVATGNLKPPLDIDARTETWPVPAADAVVCINMLHIAPWAVCQGLMRGAGRVLPDGGVLYLYGPYMLQGRHTAPSNRGFDHMLRSENPEWGVRDLDVVTAEAAAHRLALDETVPMPSNNLSVIFRRERTP